MELRKKFSTFEFKQPRRYLKNKKGVRKFKIPWTVLKQVFDDGFGKSHFYQRFKNI